MKTKENYTAKYFLSVEFRYSFKTLIDDDPDEYETQYKTKIIHSDLFDTEKECTIFGNRLIGLNLWAEQYPGLIGQRLNNHFGLPLVMLSLKNGSTIFIKVNKLKILTFEDLNTELLKFNISKIEKEL